MTLVSFSTLQRQVFFGRLLVFSPVTRSPEQVSCAYMLNDIYTISLSAVGIANVSMVLLSLAFAINRRNPLYIKTLPVYFTINLAAEILAKIFPNAKLDIYNSFTVLELLYFTAFFLQTLKSVKWQRTILILDAVFVSLYLRHLLIYHRVNYGPHGPVFFEALIMILGCSAYLGQLFSGKPTMNVSEEPAFWMVIGILFYFVVLLPVVWISQYYLRSGRPELSDVFYSVNNYAQIISYIIFLKAIHARRK